jgi:hypothetical protein
VAPQLAARRETAAFAPIAVAPDARELESAPASGCAPAMITIAFGAQVRVTIEGAPDADTLSSVIGALAG